MNVPESMINYKKIVDINNDITDFSYDIMLCNHANLNGALNRMIGKLSTLRDRIQGILIERYPFVWDCCKRDVEGLSDDCT